MSLPDMMQGDDANIKGKGNFSGHIGIANKYILSLYITIALT